VHLVHPDLDVVVHREIDDRRVDPLARRPRSAVSQWMMLENAGTPRDRPSVISTWPDMTGRRLPFVAPHRA
jgi:hypothetical protein